MQTDTGFTYREIDLDTARWLHALGHHVEWKRRFDWSPMIDQRNFNGREKYLGYSYRVRKK